MLLKCLWFALLFSTGACSTITHGKPFDTTRVRDIQEGVQDKDLIKTWFGKPDQTAYRLTENLNGCVELWQWFHVRREIDGSTVGELLMVQFDAVGKVCVRDFFQIKR